MIFLDIGIIGGDLRIIKLAELYAKEGNNVYAYGIEKYYDLEMENNLGKEIDLKEKKHTFKNIYICNNIEETIKNVKIIISAIPFSKDGTYINAPFSSKKIEIEDLEKKIIYKIDNKHKTENINGISSSRETLKFIAGGIPKKFLKECEILKNEKDLIFSQNNDNQLNEKFKIADIKIIDLLQNEKLTILNAIATVEGTIKIAIQEREESIFESNILICGYGRIGKIMCDRFNSLGANVYCTARKEKDLTWMREKGYTPLTYDEVPKIGAKIDIVINTVPSLVLNEKEIDSFKQDILMIDVASAPGGINKEYSKRKGIRLITALGIPGKEMPKTAAKFIKESII